MKRNDGHLTPEALASRRLVTVTQAGIIADLSRSTVMRLAREGRLPGLVEIPGHQRRVKVAPLLAWLNAQGAGD
jgi:hypothetical protein